jgi:hypothetical protein
MRNQKKIVVDIDEEGNCSIDGQGFQGPECAHFIGEVEKALGEKTSQEDKPEYRQRRTTSQRDRQVGGR